MKRIGGVICGLLIVLAVSNLHARDAIPKLIQLLDSPHQPVRFEVTELLGELRAREAIPGLIKRLGDDPWQRFAHAIQLGQTIEATVTRVMPYGAFAKVSEGVEGLIHVSELAANRVADPNEVVRIGDVLPVKIIGVDGERRRLSLSARLAEHA